MTARDSVPALRSQSASHVNEREHTDWVLSARKALPAVAPGHEALPAFFRYQPDIG